MHSFNGFVIIDSIHEMQCCDVKLIIIYAATLHLASTRNCRPCNCNDNPSGNPETQVIPPFPENREVHIPKISDVTAKPKKRCCPYDFDSKICRVVNDRLLCGYNKNSGRLEHHDSIIELSGGCRIRNGRLECGYAHGPFTNPRRPPARDTQNVPNNDDEPENHSNHDDDEEEGAVTMKNVDKLKTNSSNRDKIQKEEGVKDVKCVEINDRIVCKSS